MKTNYVAYFEKRGCGWRKKKEQKENSQEEEGGNKEEEQDKRTIFQIFPIANS